MFTVICAAQNVCKYTAVQTYTGPENENGMDKFMKSDDKSTAEQMQVPGPDVRAIDFLVDNPDRASEIAMVGTQLQAGIICPVSQKDEVILSVSPKAEVVLSVPKLGAIRRGSVKSRSFKFIRHARREIIKRKSQDNVSFELLRLAISEIKERNLEEKVDNFFELFHLNQSSGQGHFPWIDYPALSHAWYCQGFPEIRGLELLLETMSTRMLALRKHKKSSQVFLETRDRFVQKTVTFLESGSSGALSSNRKIDPPPLHLLFAGRGGRSV
jgi:hypothetical protein